MVEWIAAGAGREIEGIAVVPPQVMGAPPSTVGWR
jgi:hypothetical protein